MCVMALNLCIAEFCMQWENLTTFMTNHTKNVPVLSVKLWVNTTHMATAVFMMHLYALHKTFLFVNHLLMATATLAVLMATAQQHSVTPKHAFQKLQKKCLRISTKTPLICTQTLMKRLCNQGCFLQNFQTFWLTVPMVLLLVWQQTFHHTTWARLLVAFKP